MDNFYFYTEALTVGYHGVPLIKDIRLELKKGEILTLIGPNGAGKTTILRSIIRQLSPLCGTAWLDGRKISEMTGNELARELAVVLTERIRPEMMTCGDVVATGRYPYTGKFGVLSGEDKRIVDESMELVRIHELKDRDFDKISDGQKQRVMLARALCQQPDLIVLAGCLVVIPEKIIKAFENRIINIHPSLIPSFCGTGYYGLKVHEKALARGVKVSGATVHFVDEGTDTGPIIDQKAVYVQEGDTPEVLQRRIMEQAEWVIMPKAIDDIANGRIRVADGKVIRVSGEEA